MASKRAGTVLLRTALSTRPIHATQPASRALISSISISCTTRTTTSPTLHPAQTSRYSTTPPLRKEPPPQPTEIHPSTLYNFSDLTSFTTSPSPHRILIDVREPSELLSTGTIPGSKNIPVSSAPDAFFLSPEEFEDKYGFERPGKGDEVVFFCKAGVRSKAAARLAQQAAFGGRVAEYPGSWVDWVGSGGEVEKV